VSRTGRRVFLESASRGLWPIRNGGNETLIYVAVFLSLAVYGAGALALDSLRYRRKDKQPAYAVALDVSAKPIRRIQTIDLVD